MKLKLKDHQKEAAKKALSVKRGGLLIPTGGGKTTTSLVILKFINRPTIVITQAALIGVWFEENEKFELGLKLSKDYKTHRGVFVTSYDWIKLYPEVLNDFEVVILDEALSISNTDTERYKMLSEKLKSKRFLFLLAGYPVENKMDELFVFSLVTDGLGKTYDEFIKRYFDVVQIGPHNVRKTLKPGAFEKILDIIKPVTYIVDKGLIRTSEYVTKIYPVWFELTDYQLDIIDAITLDGSYKDDKISIECPNKGVKFFKKMQVVSGFVYQKDGGDANEDDKETYPVFFDRNPKKEKFDELFGQKDNFLLWYFYDSEFEAIKDYKKSARLSKIQTDSKGLNLQSYKFSVYYTVPVSGGQFLQGIDRLDRMGRTGDINIYLMLPKHEFGERILDIVKTKKTLSKKVINYLLA